MSHHREVDVAVPGRDALIEPAYEQVGIGPAIDEHAGAIGCLQQDGIALADVEHAYAQLGRWSRDEHDRDDTDQHDGHRQAGQSSSPP